jgi:hypothetical protein
VVKKTNAPCSACGHRREFDDLADWLDELDDEELRLVLAGITHHIGSHAASGAHDEEE